MSDADQTDWAQHATAEGAAVSADPGESGDVTVPPSDAADAEEPQPETTGLPGEDRRDGNPRHDTTPSVSP